MMSRMLAAALFASVFWSHFGFAASWPEKPVRIIVAFPAGGGSDALARLLLQPLSAAFQQQFYIENKPGAGGNVAADIVSKAAADGYTLFLSPPGPPAQNRLLYRTLPFDPDNDFTPIVALTDMPVAIMAKNALEQNDVGSVVNYLKEHPNKLSYGSPGVGTIGHLTGELFKQVTNTEMIHVPYRGSAPALQDVLGGFVDIVVDNLPPYSEMAVAKKLKVLAVAAPDRAAALPDVPSLKELGLAKVQGSSWIGLLGPAKMDPAIVVSLNRALNNYLESEDGKRRLSSLGYTIMGGPPNRLSELIRIDVDRWSPVIARLKVTLD